MLYFLHLRRLRRVLFSHGDLMIDICSPYGESLLAITLPDGVINSSEASLSAFIFPSIPEWLGIQCMVVLDLLDLRQAREFIISATHRFFGGVEWNLTVALE